jgi:hypothetical protein
MPALPSLPATDAMLQMRPEPLGPCVTITFSAALHMRNVPVVFTRNTRSKSASSTSWVLMPVRPAGGPTPHHIHAG